LSLRVILITRVYITDPSFFRVATTFFAMIHLI
jgi:hypothetical protein